MYALGGERRAEDGGYNHVSYGIEFLDSNCCHYRVSDGREKNWTCRQDRLRTRRRADWNLTLHACTLSYATRIATGVDMYIIERLDMTTLVQ